MIYEIDRSILKKECNGSIKKAITDGWYMIWDAEKIRHAFNYGHGTIKDFERYKRDNKRFAIWVEL